MKLFQALGCSLLVACMVSCAAVGPYQSELPANLQITTSIDSGSKITFIAAGFDIHRVDSKCQLSVQGRVQLNKPPVHIGIPVGQPLFLQFIFESGGVFASRSTLVGYETLLLARPGYQYVAHVSYVRGIYDVVISETRPRLATRVVERRPLSSCVKA